MNLYCALVHYPVYNKDGEVIVSSITTSNIHDISRSAKTYALEAFFFVTPILRQQRLIQAIKDHWSSGYGSIYNPTRKIALETIRVTSYLGECIEQIEIKEGTRPFIVVTCAKGSKHITSYNKLREELISGDSSWLILFGTGWGLTMEIIEMADRVLEPIRGPGEYNHLSVRAAVAITLDRLLG